MRAFKVYLDGFDLRQHEVEVVDGLFEVMSGYLLMKEFEHVLRNGIATIREEDLPSFMELWENQEYRPGDPIAYSPLVRAKPTGEKTTKTKKKKRRVVKKPVAQLGFIEKFSLYQDLAYIRFWSDEELGKLNRVFHGFESDYATVIHKNFFRLSTPIHEDIVLKSLILSQVRERKFHEQLPTKHAAAVEEARRIIEEEAREKDRGRDQQGSGQE